MEQTEKKISSWKKKAVVILCVVLAVILVLIAAVIVWMNALLGRRGELNNETLSAEQIDSAMRGEGQENIEYGGPEIDPNDVELPVEPVELITKNEHVVNILLVGQDRRKGESRMHSDAMILCTINMETKTLTMTSFLRDVWVAIPGYGNQRLNVPYLLEGFGLLNKTLEYNFGVSADYNVEIDFSGFMKAIDKVGGVDVELTEKEADYLNRRGNWDVEKNTHWNLTAGINHLNGSQALAYSRIRQIGMDFARTNRQRTVLMALVEKAKTLDAAALYDLIYDMIPLLATDMSDGQIIGLAVDLVPILKDLQVVSQRIPIDNGYSFANIEGNEVIVLGKRNYKSCRELLEQTLGTK